ncbi:methyltransferase-like protein [Xylariales sp. PMI_506]|nr:methyltransferase-like protein [Xylariales sp. PMI_506]
MADYDTVTQRYRDQAATYDDYLSLPLGILETQLIASALGDCTGLAVLDLGGGNGLRARQVVDLGAARVDVVDLSPDMLEAGQNIEIALGRRDKIHWHEADVSKSLAHLSLKPTGTYDLVMANWLFGHAGTVDMLEDMWRNITVYLKPGGRFIGARVASVHSPAAASGVYGLSFKDFKEIPGGWAYRYEIYSEDPPVTAESVSLAISYTGSTELHQKFGLEDVQIEPYEGTAAVRGDPEFWKPFLDDPFFAVVKATKAI